MTDAPPPPQQPAGPAAGAPLSESEDKQWASFAHLGGIIGVLPALIIWLVFKDRGQRTNVEGKEALNFQITVTIGYIACVILGSVLAIVLIGFLFYLVMLVIWVLAIVWSIIGFTKVNGGGSYRYPFALRLIK